MTVDDLDNGFYIEDDGLGIAEEDREDVFDARVSTTEAETGFGLSIVDQVIEDHGWEIAVSNSRDGGARFEVTGVTAASE